MTTRSAGGSERCFPFLGFLVFLFLAVTVAADQIAQDKCAACLASNGCLYGGELAHSDNLKIVHPLIGKKRDVSMGHKWKH